MKRIRANVTFLAITECLGNGSQNPLEMIMKVSPFGFPLHFEGAWVLYKAEKDSCFVQKNGVGTPVLVEKISV